MNDKSIFISIASYRDRELIPTVMDCIHNAANKDNLFFGIHWQRDEFESIDDILSFNINVEECDWRDSKGACWARHNIQKNLYDGQAYYLQLDSHHRFLKDWDLELFELYNEAKKQSEKPLIGTYGTTYFPNKNLPLKNEPYRINTFASFGSDGDIISRPVFIKNHIELAKERKLIKARLLSGHFIFGSAQFIDDCMYDPNFYFRGEELSLSARAYTHGYDFYHPTKTIIWHEYLREQSHKHWLDHVKNNGFVQEGEDRNKISKARQRQLFGIDQCNIDFKHFGFGNQRTLHDYELYVGLDFKNLKVHKSAHDSRDEYLEPSIMSEADWRSGMLEKYDLDIQWTLDKIPEKEDYTMFFCGFETDNGKLLFRQDLKDNKYLKRLSTRLHTTIYVEEKPTKCIIIPYSNSNGWGERTIINI